MIHCSYPFDQWRTQKNICIKHHAEAHFEDPIKETLLRYAPKKCLYLCLECPIRKGVDFFHNNPGGAYGRFDL